MGGEAFEKRWQREGSYVSVFSEAEIEYLQGKRIGRMATVSEAGEPHVVPARFRYNPEADAIEIGGHGMGKSKKYRDAARSGHERSGGPL